MKNKLNTRAFRQGSVASAITVAVVAVIIVLNVLVARAGDRFGLRLDLTAGHLFSLTDATTSYLTSLDRDVDIYVLNTKEAFASEGDYMLQAAEVLAEYARHSPRVSLHYVNLMENPGFFSQYPTAQANDILVVSGERSRLVMPSDLYNIQSDQYGVYIASSKAEQTMTSAIIYATSSETTHAVILTGHLESEAAGLDALLQLNNYETSTISLASQDIPADAALVILDAPRADYTEDELRKLDRYLYNGGAYGKTLFYLAGVDQPALPALDAFLAQWGVAVRDAAVFETDYGMLAGNGLFLTNVLYSEQEYAKAVYRSGLPVAMPNARPLEILETQGVTVTTLLNFSPTAGARPFDAPENWQPTQSDMRSGMNALLLAQQSDAAGEKTSNVLVAASSLAVAEANLSRAVCANSGYFLSLLGTLTQRADNIIIESKAIGSPVLGLTYAQALTWGFVFTIALPLAVLIAGAVVFFRRRHL